MPDQSSLPPLDPQSLPLPASIRTNNPGAQWFGPVAAEFGARGAEKLPGGNNAAIFPDPVSGAAAHFALLNRNYMGMPLSEAVAKWSGGNSSPQYAQFIARQAGIAPETVLTPDLLASPQGAALVKAQAHWEAGRPYPLSDAQWAEAQRRALSGGNGRPANVAGFDPIARASMQPGAGGGGSAVPAAPAPASPTPPEVPGLPPASATEEFPHDSPAMPAFPANALRLRNAIAGRMAAGKTGVPLPPSVAQRLASLMARNNA